MCTDVDRNDKARVCVSGTVRVTARRRIEMYSELIHTVDHVEGVLAEDRDALDGFLTHLWAVTVTGAPKLAAVEFIERVERSPRRWYGGAAGLLAFDGTLDTVLTLRTIQVRDGVATVRAGATLLHDSVPAAEEAETELKAKALLKVLDAPDAGLRPPAPAVPRPAEGLRVLVVDHRDSFSHTLADYLRQTGAEVTTYRVGSHLGRLAAERPDLLVLSPGPGRPVDFDLAGTITEAERHGIPVFGVCLGLQGLAEYFGASLSVLDRPVHGKPSKVRVLDPDSPLLAGLPKEFDAGRYHSLYVASAEMPPELRVTAETEDGVAMVVEHRERPLAAVQFHPESIMTTRAGAGHQVMANAVTALTRPSGPARP
jgi:anthranilate synthase